MKTLSCGIILLSQYREILGCHATGKDYDSETYDIPKGQMEDNEINPLETALRELKEETNFEIKHKDKIIDLGKCKYNSSKNLHLFLYKLNKFDIKKLKCKSTFKGKNGKIYPEVNGYKWVDLSERRLFYIGLQRIFLEKGI